MRLFQRKKYDDIGAVIAPPPKAVHRRNGQKPSANKAPVIQKLASRKPPQHPLRNGHAPLAKVPKRKAPATDFTTGKKDKDLAEWMGYLFGNQVPIERITDMPDNAIVPFMVMKMQVRLSTLTGAPDDPDLLAELMKDFMELEISRNRQGRREMRETISAGIKAHEEDDPEGNLFGRLRK